MNNKLQGKKLTEPTPSEEIISGNFQLEEGLRKKEEWFHNLNLFLMPEISLTDESKPLAIAVKDILSRNNLPEKDDLKFRSFPLLKNKKNLNLK